MKLFGEDIRVQAQRHTVGGLSAHADQQGLLDWYASIPNRPPVGLVHALRRMNDTSVLGAMARVLTARGRPAEALDVDGHLGLLAALGSGALLATTVLLAWLAFAGVLWWLAG